MMSTRTDHFTVEQVEQVVTFSSDDAMQKEWKASYLKINTKTYNSGTVLKTIVAFLTKPFAATVVGKAFTGDWTAQNDEGVLQENVMSINNNPADFLNTPAFDVPRKMQEQLNNSTFAVRQL